MSNSDKKKEIEEKRIQLNEKKELIKKEIINTNQEEAFRESVELYEDGIVNDVYYEKEAIAINPKISNYQKELIDSLIVNKNGTTSINQLKAGNAIINEYKFINNEKFFYKYDPNRGVWEKITKQSVRSLITNDLEKTCKYYSDGTSRSLMNFVFDKTYGNIKGETFDQVFNIEPYNIVFKNGTLNMRTGEFFPGFDKEDYNTIVIPHNYIKEVERPLKTFRFLSMMTSNIDEMTFIFQWIGFLMVKKYDIQKMLFLVGDGGNGKSTLIKLMTAVVGANNTSTVSMKSLINNKFQSSLLYNKLFNTVADIGADFFDDSSILKALTGDDHITIERKGENGFSYLNFAKMTYSCNKLPKFKDTTGGLQRRPIILPLNEDFTNLVKNSDIHINDIINDPEEMEKIVNYSIKKFKEVIENGKEFTESEAMIQAKNDWLSDDPLLDFIEEAFEIVDNDKLFVKMEDFILSYKNYCSDRNYKPMSQKNAVEAIKGNKKLRDRKVEVKRINSKTKKLKITRLIQLVDNTQF